LTTREIPLDYLRKSSSSAPDLPAKVHYDSYMIIG